MEVDIQAYAKVTFSKVVDMSEEDYQKYLEIINSKQSNSTIDKLVADIANKYGFYGSGEDILDLEDPEEIEFTKL